MSIGLAKKKKKKLRNTTKHINNIEERLCIIYIKVYDSVLFFKTKSPPLSSLSMISL